MNSVVNLTLHGSPSGHDRVVSLGATELLRIMNPWQEVWCHPMDADGRRVHISVSKSLSPSCPVAIATAEALLLGEVMLSWQEAPDHMDCIIEIQQGLWKDDLPSTEYRCQG